MKLSRVFSNHSNLRLKNAVRAIRTGFLFDFVYCWWHNLIIRIFLFFCFGIYAKFEFNVQRVLFNYYMRFVLSSLSFLWSCDACVQSDRCLDIPWNLTRRSYWTCCNWIACSSSHWESSELNWEFHLMSHLLYYISYMYMCVWYLSEICTFSSHIVDWIFMKLFVNADLFFFDLYCIWNFIEDSSGPKRNSIISFHLCFLALLFLCNVKLS